jgi:hypothetical protein
VLARIVGAERWLVRSVVFSIGGATQAAMTGAPFQLLLPESRRPELAARVELWDGRVVGLGAPCR